MADFNIIQKKVALSEGGYTCNKDDAGNWTGASVGEGELVGTNHGIAAHTYAHYIGHTPTKQEMIDMPYSVALIIYRNSYWTTMYGDFIKDNSVAWMIYDALIQHWDQSFYWTREAIQAQHIKVEGADVVIRRAYFNGKIIIALNSCNQEWVFDNIKQCRLKYYKKLNNPTMYEGWVNRMSLMRYGDV